MGCEKFSKETHQKEEPSTVKEHVGDTTRNDPWLDNQYTAEEIYVSKHRKQRPNGPSQNTLCCEPESIIARAPDTEYRDVTGVNHSGKRVNS